MGEQSSVASPNMDVIKVGVNVNLSEIQKNHPNICKTPLNIAL